jgi:hypothetical protein
MNQHHRGRLIDHVHLRVRDFAAAKRFYRAVLAADELWIDRGELPSRIHLAFQAPDRETVRRLPPAGRITPLPASGAITPGITRPSCSTRTATTSRPSITYPLAAPPPPS